MQISVSNVIKVVQLTNQVLFNTIFCRFKCDSNDNEDFEFGNCAAVNLFFNCKAVLVVMGVCGVKALFDFLEGIFRFNIILNFCKTEVLD